MLNINAFKASAAKLTMVTALKTVPVSGNGYKNTPSEKSTKVATTAGNLDYDQASVCPYCKNQMTGSRIRRSDGISEVVYLCREDRHVGIVPDGVEIPGMEELIAVQDDNNGNSTSLRNHTFTEGY